MKKINPRHTIVSRLSLLFIIVLTLHLGAQSVEGCNNDYPDAITTRLNYTTGELDTVTYSQIDSLQTVISWGDNSAIVELTANYADVRLVEDTESATATYWCIPGCESHMHRCEPEVSLAKIDLPVGPNIKSAKVSILDEQHKDYNYKMNVCSVLITLLLSQDRTCSIITPYEGFFPADSASYEPEAGNIRLIIPMTRYDYEHEIIRAYSKVKVQVEFLEDYETIALEDAPIGYSGMVDITNGTLYRGISLEEIATPSVDFTTSGNSTTIDLEAKQAWVNIMDPSELYSSTTNSILWLAPESSSVIAAREPQTSYIPFSIPIADNTQSFSLSTLECEYRDFHFQMKVSDSYKGTYYHDYVLNQYSGFKNPNPVTAKIVDEDGSKYLQGQIALTAYDYENETVRAYSRLKVQVNYSDQAAIQSPQAAELPARYFNLQGIEVLAPQPGNVYIERRGSLSRTIIL